VEITVANVPEDASEEPEVVKLLLGDLWVVLEGDYREGWTDR
jgi:hypothetical protein